MRRPGPRRGEGTRLVAPGGGDSGSGGAGGAGGGGAHLVSVLLVAANVLVIAAGGITVTVVLLLVGPPLFTRHVRESLGVTSADVHSHPSGRCLLRRARDLAGLRHRGCRAHLSDRAIGVLLLVAAVVLVVAGARLTGVSPRGGGGGGGATGRSQCHPSAGLARILRIEEREQRRYSDRNAALLGALTFFLPCGFTQTVQLFALSTGRPATAAAAMARCPAWAQPPACSAWVRSPCWPAAGAARTLFVVAGVAVLAFGFVNARAGLTDLGVRFGAVALQPARRRGRRRRMW